ncbi:hypothetical protein GGI23_004260 [Coemansia sp. RSA 2559]|nr:hypothetical protein GGI23_004260 [Coemansia sp. RSA 2559]
MPRLHPLLVIGCSAADLTSQIAESSLASHSMEGGEEGTSHPGSVDLSVGGVGQNIARAAHCLGAKSYLISALGRDFFGDSIKATMEKVNMPTSYLQCLDPPARTAVYSSLHQPNGNLVSAIADMGINDMISIRHVEEAFKELKPCVVGIDGNFPAPVLSSAIALAKHHGTCVVFEPTSVPKCTRILSALALIRRSKAIANIGGLVQMITPNKLEIKAMAEAAVNCELVESRPTADTVSEIAEKHSTLDAAMILDALTLFPVFPIQIITLGDKGVAVVSPMPGHKAKPIIRHISARKPNKVINSSGAGDSLVGYLLASLYKDQAVALSPDGAICLGTKAIDLIVSLAQQASILSLESSMAVSDRLDPGLLETTSFDRT